MKNSLNVSTLLLVMTSILSMPLHASESKVPCESLPKAVQDKGKSMLNGATMHACVKDVSKGKTEYEMELIRDGRSEDITFDPNGNVVEIEKQVDIDSVPAPVRSALEKASQGGRIEKVESLTRGESVVSYEATVLRKGKHKELAFSPDGSAMKAD